MAVYAGVVGKPLRLKDFLELDRDSCSAAGFRCYPRRLCVAGAAAAPAPTRHILEAAVQAPRGIGRSPSLRRRPGLSHLSRSISRRLRGGFSWRHREEEAAPSPAPAACSQEVAVSSSSSDSESVSSSTEMKSESDFSSTSSTESLHAAVAAAAAAGDEHEAMKGETKEAGSGSGSEADDKEQLSPVAVMDFPFDDDEDAVEEGGRDGGGACSPSFSASLVQLQRRKTQLQHKIRRFASIGELGAVDLDAHFAASDCDGLGSVTAQHQHQCCTDATTAPPRPNDGDHDEQSLLGLLKGTVSAAGVDGVSERLLLDFFAETVQKLSTSENGEAAMGLAMGWLEGTGARWGLKDVLCHRKDLVAEMERGRRWSARVVGEEEEHGVGVVLAGLVVDELLYEVVRDLLV